MIRDRANEVLDVLKSTFSAPPVVNRPMDPFKTVIRTVLSQNTTSKNAARAFKNLTIRFSITPEALAKANVKEIEKAITVAGLYRKKSRVVKNISRIILKQFDGSLDIIYSLPLEEARKTLLCIPGIGPKTADVVLLFCDGKPTIPIDTHVNRVSKRLELVPLTADYEETRGKLQSLYSPKNYLPVHLLLITLGRKCCKARKPLCKPCPVNALCPSQGRYDKTQETLET